MSFASVTAFAARRGHPAVPPQTLPAFVSAPAIVGTPTVGQTLSYTSGIYTGNPTPSVSQHWARDGVDIAGAIGATYTLVTADGGALVTVRQTITNLLGSVNSTSAPVTVPATVTPLTLAFDTQTPEQISIRAPLARSVAAGTTVLAEYKLTSSGTWLSAGYLFKVVAATQSNPVVGVVDSFAGCIFGLTSGTLYDIRLTITEPGQSVVQLVGQRSTRSLPAAAGTTTKTATPATLAAQLLTLVPGDVLQLADGTYSAITLARSGSLAAPIYIRGGTRSGTVISAPTGTAVTWGNASHIVLENMTLQGRGTSWPNPTDTGNFSNGIVFSTGTLLQTNCTVRNVTATGFDRFCKAYEPVIGRLVYNCTVTGPNTWADTYAINSFTGAVNGTWSDDGVAGPGQGNCFFDSTITGHGDALKIESSTGIYFSSAIFMYRVNCARTGDDFAEIDDGSGNIGIYDCSVANAGTGLSVDGINGGPVYYFRNRVGNTSRGPIKPTSESQNVAVFNNTFVRTTSATTFGLYASASGANTNWTVRNNLIVYRGTSDVIRWDCTLGGLDWDYNAIYPATGANITLGAGRGAYTGLTAAKAALAPLMAHDVAATTNPFAATITLGSDYTTEYTGSMDFTLSGGVSELNAGVALPGITDGFTGAAPDIGAVISGRGIAAAGDFSAAATWAPTTGRAVSFTAGGGTLTNSLYQVIAPYYESFYAVKVINDFSSMIFNPDFGDFGGFVTYGDAGHAASNINGAEVLQMKATSITWVHMLDPTPWFGSGTDSTTKTNNNLSDVTSLTDSNWGDPVSQPGKASSSHSYCMSTIRKRADGGATYGTWQRVGAKYKGFIDAGADAGPKKLDFNSITVPASNTYARVGSGARPSGATIQGGSGGCLHAFVPAQNRTYIVTNQTAQLVRYYDWANDTYNNIASTLSPELSNGTDAGASGAICYIPERSLIVCAWRVSNALQVQYMDVSTTTPTRAVATLSATISIPSGATYWTNMDWATNVGKLIIGGAANGGVLDTAAYLEVTIPTPASGTWTVTRRPFTSGTVAWNTNTMQRVQYMPAIGCMGYLPTAASGSPDTFYCFAPF